jgi:hypothetical protein
MMFKSFKMTFCLALFLFAFLSMASPFDLEQLMAIRPGDVPSKDLKLTGVLPEAKYRIQIESKHIKAISIELRKPIASDKFLKLDTKGFCLSQAISPDVPMKKYFFFEVEKKRRYELNAKQEIKSILIQDIPGASSNKPCVFNQSVVEEAIEIKKVK